MNGTLILNEQEVKGNYCFNSAAVYMTRGIISKLGNEASDIIRMALNKVVETYANHADYLQTFRYISNGQKIKFWLIHDGDNITCLLPEEY